MFLTIAIVAALIALVLWVVGIFTKDVRWYQAAKVCIAVAVVAFLIWLILLVLVTDADAFSYG